MPTNFLSAVPQFDRNLVAYVDQVLAQIEGMEVEADPESTNCVVLLLPCAGTTVKMLVSLQDVNFLDIGYVDIIPNTLKYFSTYNKNNFRVRSTFLLKTTQWPYFLICNCSVKFQQSHCSTCDRISDFLVVRNFPSSSWRITLRTLSTAGIEVSQIHIIHWGIVISMCIICTSFCETLCSQFVISTTCFKH